MKEEEEVARLKAESLIFNQVHRGPVSCLSSGSGADALLADVMLVGPGLRVGAVSR